MEVRKWILWYLAFFLFVCYVGKIVEVRNIELLGGFIHFSKFSFGTHPGRMLLPFLLLGGYFLFKNKTFPRWGQWTWYEKMALLFFGYLLLHLLWAKYPKHAKKGPEVFFYCLILYFTLKYSVQSKKDLVFLLKAFLFSSLFVGGANLIRYHLTLRAGPTLFMFQNHLPDALFIGLCVATFWLFSKDAKPRFFLSLVGGISYLAILSTDSRSFLIGAPIAFLTVSFCFYRKAIPYVILATVLAYVLSFSVYKNTSRDMQSFTRAFLVKEKKKNLSPWEWLLERLKRDSSLRARLDQIWAFALDILKEYPLGIGCKSYGVEFSKQVYKYPGPSHYWSDAHNVWLQIGMSLGYPGIAFYAFFVGSSLVFFARQLRKVPSSSFFYFFFLAVLTYLIAHFLAELLHHFYTMERFSLLFAFFLSLGIRAAEMEEKEREN